MIRIWTDGNCKNNGKPNCIGAWGFIAVEEGKEIYSASEAKKGVTNNQMELKAVINALEWAYMYNHPTLTIYMDSEYVFRGITEWIHKWKRNNWVTSNKEPVKNKFLWERLDTVSRLPDRVEFKWVKAHTNTDSYNDKVDALCNAAIKLHLA